MVRYEDMLNKPTVAFSRVARFLGLNPPRDRLERAIQASSFKSLRAQEDEEGSASAPIRPRSSSGSARPGSGGRPQQGADRPGGRDPQEQMERFGYWPL